MQKMKTIYFFTISLLLFILEMQTKTLERSLFEEKLLKSSNNTGIKC